MDCSGLTKQDMDLLQRSDLFQGCAPQAAARPPSGGSFSS